MASRRKYQSYSRSNCRSPSRSRSPYRSRSRSPRRRSRSTNASNVSCSPETKVIFVGNLPRAVTAYELKDLLVNYGRVKIRVDRIDMKGAYGFVHISGNNLDNIVDYLNPIRWKGHKLTIENAKSNEIQKWNARKNYSENKTLFIVNFNEEFVKESDFEKLFGKYGAIKRVSLRKNFGFVEFNLLKDAKVAKEKLQGYVIYGKKLVIRYAASADHKKKEESMYDSLSKRGTNSRFYRSRYESRSGSESSRSRSVSSSRSRRRNRRRETPSPFYYKNRTPTPSESRSASRSRKQKHKSKDKSKNRKYSRRKSRSRSLSKDGKHKSKSVPKSP